MPAVRSPSTSRRGLLAGAAAAVAVIAADSVARAPDAHAADGDPVIAGADNTETMRTTVTNASIGGHVATDGLAVTGGTGTASESGGTGVKGTGGSPGGTGVFGQGGNDPNPNGGGGVGVFAQGGNNGSGMGVQAQGGTPDGTGVFGNGQGSGFGVVGHGGGDNGTGVSGSGGSQGGDGVHGGGTVNGTGVVGTGGLDGGNGVQGIAGSEAGVGVLAEGTGGGTGLQVTGPALFSRSGSATVRAGTKLVSVTGVSLTSESLILALAQQEAGVAVRCVVPKPTNSRFSIHLDLAPNVDVTVGWFVVN